MKLKKLTSLLIPMVASLPFVAAACGGEGKKG
ncbi:variable surface lipoprotein, partial [Mycoplasmopsis mucosicanis]